MTPIDPRPWILVLPMPTLRLPCPPPCDLAAPQVLAVDAWVLDQAQPLVQAPVTAALLEDWLGCHTQARCARHAKAGRN